MLTTENAVMNDGFKALQEYFGARFSTSDSIRDQHGHDESFHPPANPDAVVFAESTEDVVVCMQICYQYRIPVIPFGAGTSLEGHISALEGGVSLDTSRMNRILRLSIDDLDCTVESGVLRKQLLSHLHPHGLFFPVDPGADASLGGMAATSASGTTTVRYGAMKELVLGLKVVLPDGRIVTTSRRSRKTSAGYDLTHLFIGSEGTLGVITELTLRLFGIPEAMAAATVQFDKIEDAVQAVISIIQLGIGVARIELLDSEAVLAINNYSSLALPTHNLLLLEFHGSQDVVESEARSAGVVLEEFGGTSFKWTSDESERRKLWQARHDAAYAIKAQRPGCQIFVTDVCVPISRLAECIGETKRDVTESGLYGPVIGHVGDGNFHLILVIDPSNQNELSAVEALNGRLINRALSMEGTCTGEHGIGSGKIKHLEKELGPVALSVMQVLKNSLDPFGIMNPGKIIDPSLCLE